MATLKAQIEKTLDALKVLLDEAYREIERDDMPESMDQALNDAQEATQEASMQIDIGSDFNENLDIVIKALRLIDKWDQDEDDRYIKENGP
jgi:hypothetical protein